MAALPPIRFHDLRHTCASLLIAQGEHPKLISEQLGHSSIGITMNRYGHLLPGSYDDASARLDSALFGAAASGPQAGAVQAVPDSAATPQPEEASTPLAMRLRAAGGGTG